MRRGSRQCKLRGSASGTRAFCGADHAVSRETQPVSSLRVGGLRPPPQRRAPAQRQRAAGNTLSVSRETGPLPARATRVPPKPQESPHKPRGGTAQDPASERHGPRRQGDDDSHPTRGCRQRTEPLKARTTRRTKPPLSGPQADDVSRETTNATTLTGSRVRQRGGVRRTSPRRGARARLPRSRSPVRQRPPRRGPPSARRGSSARAPPTDRSPSRER